MKNKRLPLLLVGFVIILTILWTLVSNFKSMSGPNNIVDLNNDAPIEEQVDNFISAITADEDYTE